MSLDSYTINFENLSLTLESKWCHAEPCTELVSVLVQHLVLSNWTTRRI